MKAVLRRQDVETDPRLLWNEFVRFLAASTPDELDRHQRPAHLAFWYESEVQNGGHQQYFWNRPVGLIDETIRALDSLGASAQAAILRLAGERWGERPREVPRTVE